jgi:hypothetical protein
MGGFILPPSASYHGLPPPSTEKDAGHSPWGRLAVMGDFSCLVGVPHRSGRLTLSRHPTPPQRAVYSHDSALICITVYRKGALEVVRRLQQAIEALQQRQESNGLMQEAQKQR